MIELAISLLTSKFGKYVLIVAAIGIAIIGIRQNGVMSERRKCEAAALRSQLAATKTDLAAANDAAQKAANALAESEREANENKAKVEDYAEQLRKRGPAGACALTDDDLRQLRDPRRNSR